MKISRLFLILAALAAFMVGMQPAAQAAISETLPMDHVNSWLFEVNGDGNNAISLSAATYSFPGPADQLQYNDGTGWQDFSSPTDISVGNVLFRLGAVESGQATFTGYDGAASAIAGFPLYSSLSILWDTEGVDITIFTSPEGRFSPVPIPASALLLFTGLLGLVGVRRRSTGK